MLLREQFFFVFSFFFEGGGGDNGTSFLSNKQDNTWIYIIVEELYVLHVKSKNMKSMQVSTHACIEIKKNIVRKQ